MDLGATVCTPRAPSCGRCPWRAICLGRKAGIAQDLPRKAPKAARPIRHGIGFWAVRPDGAVLLRRRPERGLLGGMIEIPSTEWRGQAWPEGPAAAARHAPAPAEWRMLPGMVRHTFTHFPPGAGRCQRQAGHGLAGDRGAVVAGRAAGGACLAVGDEKKRPARARQRAGAVRGRFYFISARIFSRSASIGVGPPRALKCQNVQPLQAGAPWTPAPTLWIDPRMPEAVMLPSARTRATKRLVQIEQLIARRQQAALDHGAERHPRLGPLAGRRQVLERGIGQIPAIRWRAILA